MAPDLKVEMEKLCREEDYSMATMLQSLRAPNLTGISEFIHEPS